MRGSFAVCCPVLLAATLLSCTSPPAITDFAWSAAQALRAGPPIFRDFAGSCIRRERDNERQNTVVYIPNAEDTRRSAEPVAQSSACQQFSTQGEAITKVSDVLMEYFRAIQQLASFNSSSVAAAGETAAGNAATAGNMSTAGIDSAAKLTRIVTEAFTERYRRAHLLEYLKQADPAIQSITDGLGTIVATNYASLLREEQRSLNRRYQDLGHPEDVGSIFLLNRAYREDLDAIRTREAAAAAFVSALRLIRDGHHQLTLQARHLDSKKIGLALAPYISSLQALPVRQSDGSSPSKEFNAKQ